MAVDVEKVITDKAEETRKTFRALLDKTNKEHPNPKDVKALSDLLTHSLNSWVFRRHRTQRHRRSVEGYAKFCKVRTLPSRTRIYNRHKELPQGLLKPDFP